MCVVDMIISCSGGPMLEWKQWALLCNVRSYFRKILVQCLHSRQGRIKVCEGSWQHSFGALQLVVIHRTGLSHQGLQCQGLVGQSNRSTGTRRPFFPVEDQYFASVRAASIWSVCIGRQQMNAKLCLKFIDDAKDGRFLVVWKCILIVSAVDYMRKKII
jgi:hypothetical protein